MCNKRLRGGIDACRFHGSTVLRPQLLKLFISDICGTEGSLVTVRCVKETDYIVNRDFDAVIAMGGGKVLDVGKYASSMSKKPFISIPTSISHDGVASPIAVLKCDHGTVRSLDCKIPTHIIMDIDIIKKAPRNLIVAGLGDLVSNITALKDWNKAVEAGKAKMDDFAYIISGTAVRAVVQYLSLIHI